MTRLFRLSSILVLVLLAFLPGCRGSKITGAELAPTLSINYAHSEELLSAHTLQTGGHARTYSVYYDGSPKGKPVVTALHGGCANGTTMMVQANLIVKAKREGFVLVSLSGLNSQFTRATSLSPA